MVSGKTATLLHAAVNRLRWSAGAPDAGVGWHLSTSQLLQLLLQAAATACLQTVATLATCRSLSHQSQRLWWRISHGRRAKQFNSIRSWTRSWTPELESELQLEIS